MSDPQSVEQVFIKKLTEIVLANLQNENFGVDDLARTAGVSRSLIHRRLKAMRNQNISQFIREIRLNRAMEMLQHNTGNVSEIAFKVGFGSPAYFNKCFHEFFGYPPGEVKRRIQTENETPSDTEAGDKNESPKSQPDSKTIFPEKTVIRKKRIFQFFAAALLITLAFVLFNNFSNRGDLFNAFRYKTRDMSIVVLPFKNFSEDQSNQYFADGIMEDILNDLYRISDLRVISRTTSERFAGTTLTAKEIARKLNAGNVLEGSVRRYGNKARISVQLIDARHDQHLWSANFDRELTDIMGIQGEIALQVAQKMKAVIPTSEKKQIGKIPTRNPEAYDNYLKGRFLLHKANSEQRSDFDIEGVMNCLQYYEKAIAEDKDFAEAYAGFANARFNLSAWGYLPASEGAYKAKDLFMKALEIDPDCAEAHAVKGAFHVWFEQNYAEGLKEFQISVRLNPNFATTRQWFAQLLMITGPIKEARIHMDRAVELEPYFWVVQNVNAWVYYFEEKYDKAIEACIIARDLKPDFTDNTWLFFLNYTKLGEGDKAVKELQTIALSCPGTSQYAQEISDAYEKNGINGLYLWLIEVNKNKPIPVDGMNGHPFYIAWWNAILGNKEEAIYWLQKNMERESRLYLYFMLIGTCPDFTFIADDPRFLTIIEEIGLGPFYTTKP